MNETSAAAVQPRSLGLNLEGVRSGGQVGGLSAEASMQPALSASSTRAA